jgi:cytochrome P450
MVNNITSDNIENKHLKLLEYTHRFIKEVLRFYTPLPFYINRECTKDFMLTKDIQIKKGYQVHLHLPYKKSELFENPDEFNPDRWLDSKKE